MRIFQILLAEDNRADVLLIGEALKLHGIPHELHLMSDGASVLKYLETMGAGEGGPAPDVVLLDLNLPKVDGLEVLKELRRYPQCETTPVIIISSSDTPKDRQKMAALDVTHYFKKPSDFDEFMKLGQVLRQVLQSEAGHPSLTRADS
jgi:two-component system, chemotaxis family, response regulator Rcp1